MDLQTVSRLGGVWVSITLIFETYLSRLGSFVFDSMHFRHMFETKIPFSTRRSTASFENVRFNNFHHHFSVSFLFVRFRNVLKGLFANHSLAHIMSVFFILFFFIYQIYMSIRHVIYSRANRSQQYIKLQSKWEPFRVLLLNKKSVCYVPRRVLYTLYLSPSSVRRACCIYNVLCTD